MKVVHRMKWKKSDEYIAGNWGITSEWTAKLLNLRNGKKDEENSVWRIAETEVTGYCMDFFSGYGWCIHGIEQESAIESKLKTKYPTHIPGMTVWFDILYLQGHKDWKLSCQ